MFHFGHLPIIITTVVVSQSVKYRNQVDQHDYDERMQNDRKTVSGIQNCLLLLLNVGCRCSQLADALASHVCIYNIDLYVLLWDNSVDAHRTLYIYMYVRYIDYVLPGLEGISHR